MIYVFLANGFEETEAVTVIDILRRCGKEVLTVGIGDNVITGSHNITLVTDTQASLVELNDSLEMIVLPGGMPGTINLEKSETVKNAIEYCKANDIYIAAICAAPSILGHMGLLDGKKAVCYPGFEQELNGAEVKIDSVMTDGKIITSRGPGTAVDFSLKLVEILVGEQRSKLMGEALVCM